MNGLSWFIYLAEVSTKLSDLLNISFWVGCVIFIAAAMLTEAHDYPFQGVVEGKLKVVGWTFILLSIGVISVILPSKETIYLIAGSEAGEMAVTSEAGQEILSDIQQVIKHQLGELKGE